MKDEKAQKAIILISRNGIQFFETSSSQVATMAFDPKAVRDMTIADSKALSTAIGNFIAQYKLIPAAALFVFTEATCFYHDTPEKDEIKQKALAQEFVNNVPFETVLTKVYKTKNGARIVSINERLYRDIASSFESKGFVSFGAVPLFVIGGKEGLASSMDTALARRLLGNMDFLREQGFFAIESPSGEGRESDSEAETVSKKNLKVTPQLIVLGVVFVVLIGVLVFLIIRR